MNFLLKYIVKNFIFLCCLCIISIPLFSEIRIKGKDIMQKADRRFYPYEGSYDVNVKILYPNNRSKEFSLKLYKKNTEYQTVIWTYPDFKYNDIGIRMKDTIYFKPNNWRNDQVYTYKAIFVDSGFSWGDLLHSDLSLNYEVVEITKEIFRNSKVFHLLMKPLQEGFYARLDVFIEMTTFNTLKRIYYTPSGKMLKTAYYSDIKVKNNMIVGFKVTMYHHFLEMQSFAEVKNIKNRKIPAYMFDPECYARIKPLGEE